MKIRLRLVFQRIGLLAAFLMGNCFDASQVGQAQERVVRLHPGIELKTEVRYHPRLIRLYLVRVDLTTPGLMLDVVVGPDPDGDGPAEASLEDPIRLAERGGFIVGISANAWGTYLLETEKSPGPHGAEKLTFRPIVINVSGWLKTRNRTVSQPERGRWSFWIRPDGTPEIGNPLEEVPAQIAVSGFGPLLVDGKIVAGEGGVPDVQAGIGIDHNRSTVLLAIVDGRRPGWSQGLTNHEFAKLLQEAGAWTAMKGDCGGTAVLVARGATGRINVVNRPTDLTGPRPIPCLLGVTIAP